MRHPVTRQVDCPASIQRRVRRAVEVYLSQEREDGDERHRAEAEVIMELRRNGTIRPLSVI